MKSHRNYWCPGSNVCSSKTSSICPQIDICNIWIIGNWSFTPTVCSLLAQPDCLLTALYFFFFSHPLCFLLHSASLLSLGDSLLASSFQVLHCSISISLWNQVWFPASKENWGPGFTPDRIAPGRYRTFLPIKEVITKVGGLAFMLCCIFAPSKLGLDSKTWVDKLGVIFRQILDPVVLIMGEAARWRMEMPLRTASWFWTRRWRHSWRTARSWSQH